MTRQHDARSADTPDVDPLAGVNIHPAAELFPLIHGAEFDELVRDIAEHGQREPIVFTPDNQLLDGRNRWRACAAAGAVPITRVEESEPWSYVISTNLHRRHLSDSQRALIAARVAKRPPGNLSYERIAHSGEQPLTQKQAAQLLNVGTGSVARARQVVVHGTPDLQSVVEAGSVAVATAARVATHLPDDEQDEFARQVRGGADPAAIAPPPADPVPAPAVHPIRGRMKSRHRTVGAEAAERLMHALDAVGLVLDGAPDGLDPSITNEQASHLVAGLSRSAAHQRRLMSLLKERKESTS